MFLSRSCNRLWTGDGILSQIGVATPNPTVTAVLTLLLVGGSAAGSAQTLLRVQNGEMSYAQFKKYVNPTRPWTHNTKP